MRVMKRNPVGHYRIAPQKMVPSNLKSIRDHLRRSTTWQPSLECWPFSAVADTKSEGQRQRITMAGNKQGHKHI